MPAITDAATLLIALKQSGTGEGKLDVIREVLKTNPDATADDAINALANVPTVTQKTLTKAMQLAEHGEVLPEPEVKTLTLEEQILERRKQAAQENQKQAVLTKLATEFADPAPNQPGASQPQNFESQPTAVGPGKVETIREAALPTPAPTPVKNPSKKS